MADGRFLQSQAKYADELNRANPLASQQPGPIPEPRLTPPTSGCGAIYLVSDVQSYIRRVETYCAASEARIARLEAALREFLEHVGTVEQPNACCRVTKFRKDKLRAALATPLGTPGREKP